MAQNMRNYKAVMASEKGPEVHSFFLDSQKAWIEVHNSGEGDTRLKDPKKLNEARKRLEAEIRHT